VYSTFITSTFICNIMKEEKQKFDIGAAIGVILVIILMLLTQLLTSCVDIPEPEVPLHYTYTIEKDCQSCNIGFWENNDNPTLLNYKIPYRIFTGEAISGDTLNIRVVNIAGGVNNNILFPVNGLLTVEGDTTYYERDLGGANYRQVQYIFK
jgi:hypothetical protein